VLAVPPRWRETYDAIKEIRSHLVAPVDTMGCDRAQLKKIVSLMLSSQTKDEVTDAAVSKLREVVGGSLSVDAMLVAEEDTISEAIGKVGSWRRKTQSVYSCIVIIHEHRSYHTIQIPQANGSKAP
jgi:endonuclease III